MSDEEREQAAQNATPTAPASVEDVAPTTRKARKWPILVSVLALFLTVFFVAFLHWHEVPSFCNAFCHQPMDKYVEGYYSGDEGLSAAVHKEAGVTCLGCHWPQAKLLDLVHEVVYYATDSFTDPLPDHSQAVDGVASFVSDDFCGRCHDGSIAPTKESATESMFVANGVTYDPHNIPQDVSWHQTAGFEGGSITCGDCHTIHKSSQLLCAECHSDAFNAENAPAGWVIPTDLKAQTASMGMFDPHAIVGTDTFANLNVLHTTMGENGTITCTDCHGTDGTNRFICAECHSDSYEADTLSKLEADGWVIPASYTTVNTDSMAALDPHSLITTDAFTNAEVHQTAGANGLISCADCHTADGNVFICAQCHASDYDGLIPSGWTVPEAGFDVPMMGAPAPESSEATADEATSEQAAPATDLSSVPDGTYEGIGKGIGGDVPVSVTVAGGKITEVTVGENAETQGIGSKAIEQLPAAIVEANGTDGVDAVAGASVTSKAIFDAVAEALASATA